MNRRDLLLSVLTTANGAPFTPVQIQKAVFLIARNAPKIVTDGPNYEFAPYDYGPFDRNVYLDAELLSAAGDVVVAPSPEGRWSTYAASESGRIRGQKLLDNLPAQLREYLAAVSKWVRAQSFGSLVRSIYDQYPEMRENSIFKG